MSGVAQPVLPGIQREPSLFNVGRSVWVDWSLFASTLVIILNGRPDENSIIGATVKSDRNFSQPLPLRHSMGEFIAPLNTKRCRWSNNELALSALKLFTSCAISRVCRSDESSIEC